LEELEFVWLDSDQPLEVGIGGIYVNSMSFGEGATALIQAVFELELNYSAYLKSAAYVQSILAGTHTADRLLQDILQATQSDSSLRTQKYMMDFQ
jgi:hypothetical protein